MPQHFFSSVIPSLFFLFTFLFISFANPIDHCEFILATTESNQTSSCIKCFKHHILDSTGTICQQKPLQLTNCIQLSIFGECQRCDCGFSLSSDKNTCVPSPIHLKGCEVLDENSICVRPKSEFVFLKTNETISAIEYSRGSHCEILDTIKGQCEQCHSGFKLKSPSNICLSHSHKLVNEHFSYFSQDGELHSRSVELIASHYGVFQKINHCEKQSSKEINSTYQSFCELCELGKILNNSKTLCIKPPFELCAKISDSDQNLCIECLDNENFYLTQEQGKNHLVCVPREAYQLDPTERCLQRFNDSPWCKVCMKGLISTFEGCSIETNMIENLQRPEKPTIFYDFNTENPQQTSLSIVLQIFNQKASCEFFSEDNSTCVSCIQGMILDISGNCQQQTDFNCYLVNTSGECLRCISLMHYDTQYKKCILIEDFFRCSMSSGTSTDCSLCLENNPLSQDNNCMLGSLFIHCQTQNALNPQNICDICDNLYFLGENNASCELIAQYEECFFSDGIIDKCEVCKNGFVLDEDSELCVSLIQFDFEAGACTNRFFYRQQQQTNANETTRYLCVKYSFLNFKQCFRFHPEENECLECQSGYFLLNNQCHEANQCIQTNGIDDFCYLAQSFYAYIDEFGKVIEIEDQNCLTNKIEYACSTCALDELNVGVYLNDNITCISFQIIDRKYLDFCYQVRQQNGKYVCDLCGSTFYPDSNGICQEVSDQNCEVSGGRLNQCRLCNKFYVLSETGICITGEVQTPVPFCKTMEGNRCRVCKNGYYLNNLFCQAISIPNCKLANGIIDSCIECVDGYVMIKSSLQVQCFEKQCEKNERGITCRPCKQGYFLREIQEFMKDKIYACVRQSILHCEIKDGYKQSCLKCSPGYFRSFKYFNYSEEVVCRPIGIDNCLDAGFDGRDCKQCQEGYSLLQSGQCFKQEFCSKFKEGICSECEDKYYYHNRICKRIENCERQHHKTCDQCLPGYWRKKRNEKDYRSRNENEENFSRISIQIKKVPRRSVGLIAEEEIDSIDGCFRILHCSVSNGNSQTCKKCDLGYSLIQGICVKEDSNSLENKICRRFAMSKDGNQIVCVECQSLFYLDQNACKSLGSSPPCVLSDGIHRNCLKCSYFGWILNIVRGECELIANCEISNGINWCVKCGKDYVVDDSGVVCERLEVNIENCEIYSYQRVDRLPAIFSNSITIETNKALEFKTINSYLVSKDQMSNQDLTLEAQARVGCVTCKMPYFLRNFQECISVDNNQIIEGNCQRFDDSLQMCTACVDGFFPRQKGSFISTEIVCSKLHWHIKLRNLGCTMFNTILECWQCLDAFYLDSNGFCQPRRVLLQKCRVFNPRKDECVECNSGYKLIEIESEKASKMGICLNLEPHEQVENCAEYLPNTNKCIKCKKLLKEKNVLEYVLNQDLNVCEDVLGMMCREIDYTTKACIEKYIEHCEEYERDSGGSTDGSGCAKCSNGYFLVQEGRECLQHDQVDNCLVYSRIQRNVCEVCEPRYYLDKVAIKCIRNSHGKCAISMKDQDLCETCENEDNISKECMKSVIPNCKTAIVSENGEQTCLECHNNFQVIDSGKHCSLNLFDFNCKTFGNSKGKCYECNTGYLLNHKGLCTAIASSICQISSCLEYSIESTEEDLICKKCLENFFLNGSHECEPFDPESDLQEQTNSVKEESLGGKEEISQNEKRQSIIGSILTILVCLVILLAVIIGLFVCFRRDYLKRQGKKRNAEDFREFVEQQDHQQQQQPSTEIQMDSTISIKGSLEYTLNQ